jgi:hypothetical protein
MAHLLQSPHQVTPVASLVDTEPLTLPRHPWRAPLQVQNVLSRCCYNSLLTGVAFCGERSQHLAAISYDTDELHVWKAIAA